MRKFTAALTAIALVFQGLLPIPAVFAVATLSWNVQYFSPAVPPSPPRMNPGSNVVVRFIGAVSNLAASVSNPEVAFRATQSEYSFVSAGSGYVSVWSVPTYHSSIDMNPPSSATGTVLASLPVGSSQFGFSGATFSIPQSYPHKTFDYSVTYSVSGISPVTISRSVAINVVPHIRSVSFSKSSLISNGIDNAILSVQVLDYNGCSDIAAVNANLSELWGSSTESLSFSSCAGDGVTATYVSSPIFTTAPPGTKNMTFADFKQVCENLKAVGVSIATLSGWEPMLLWNELRSFIGYAKETFKEVRMTTNGTLLNEKTVQNILELDSIQISIDGPEDVHDAIRGVGNYRKATTAIELIKDKLPVSVMMTIHDFNHAHFQDVITYARNNNVSIGFERITNVGRGKDYNGLSKNNFRKIVKVARENGIESTDPIYATTNKKRNEYLFCKAIQGGCSAGFVSITIDSDLSVYPCARLRINVGNLREKSLSDILKASPIINTLCNRRLLKGKCQRCPKKFICGGCRAAAFSVSGDYLGEDPQCIL